MELRLGTHPQHLIQRATRRGSVEDQANFIASATAYGMTVFPKRGASISYCCQTATRRGRNILIP
jgi:hypothetical protein